MASYLPPYSVGRLEPLLTRRPHLDSSSKSELLALPALLELLELLIEGLRALLRLLVRRFHRGLWSALLSSRSELLELLFLLDKGL